MKKFVPLGLVAAILMAAMVVGSSPATVNAQGAGLVSSIINKMEANRRNLKSLRASISMEKYNSQTGDNDRRNGIVLYVPAAGRNANVRIDWKSPQETLAVTDGQYTLYRPRLGQAIQGNARSGNKNTKASGALELLNMSKQQLQSRYELQYLNEETLWGGVATSHLKVVPRGAASYKYAEFWVDGSGMIVQTKMIEKNDDATTVRLMNVEKNAGISLEEFRLKLDGVKIVKG